MNHTPPPCQHLGQPGSAVTVVEYRRAGVLVECVDCKRRILIDIDSEQHQWFRATRFVQPWPPKRGAS